MFELTCYSRRHSLPSTTSQTRKETSGVVCLSFCPYSKYCPLTWTGRTAVCNEHRRRERPKTQNTEQKLRRKIPLLQQFLHFYSPAPKPPRLVLISYANTTHAIITSTGLHTTKPEQGPLISVKGFIKLPFSFSRLHPQKQYYNLHLIYWFMQFPFLHNFRITSSLSSHRFLHLKLQVTFDLIWILYSTHQARLHRS